MTTNNQFSIAVHLMAGLGYNQGKGITSSTLAQSINASPSFVRRTLSKLSKAKLVSTTTGKLGKCSLAKDAGQISLLDIYKAVEAPKVFAIHAYPVQASCEVSCGIKSSLEKVLSKSQKSMEDSLGRVRLSEVISDVKQK
jgi:Rrf2 family protein